MEESVQTHDARNIEGTGGEPASGLFKHSKRPEWGIAIVAYEQPDKKGFQFEDGKLRIIRDGYYDLLEPVDLPRERAEELVAQLERLGGITSARRDMANEARAGGKEVISLQKQLKAFTIKYPEGFSGETWSSYHRGNDVEKTLKRHRSLVAAETAETLAERKLRELLAAGDHRGVVDAWASALKRTDLVSPKSLGQLKDLPDALVENAAPLLIDLLYGEGPLKERFDAFARAVPTAEWDSVTAALALLYPEEHVCVRINAFKKQALWMSPRMAHSKIPMGAIYERYQEMCTRLKVRIEEAGLTPVDFLDVHDFIKISLAPATLKLLDGVVVPPED